MTFKLFDYTIPYHTGVIPFVRFPFLNALDHHDEIWKPDISFIKHGTFKVNSGRLTNKQILDVISCPPVLVVVLLKVLYVMELAHNKPKQMLF